MEKPKTVTETTSFNTSTHTHTHTFKNKITSSHCVVWDDTVDASIWIADDQRNTRRVKTNIKLAGKAENNNIGKGNMKMKLKFIQSKMVKFNLKSLFFAADVDRKKWPSLK